jgi:hypothetical protein
MKDESSLLDYFARRAQDDEVIAPNPERPADLAARYTQYKETACREFVESALADI